jgi:type I restriction enzyme S subunit
MEVRGASAAYAVTATPQVPRGYKQTEVGVILEDWELSNLMSLSAFITKGSTPTTYGFKWEQSGVLFLRSECVAENGLDLSQSMFISEAAHASLRRSEVKQGDILITITGYVGRAIIFKNAVEANINQHIARVRIISPNVSREFIYYMLAQPSYRARFNSITTGQAYPQISLKQVRETRIPLPPIKAEQEAIAEALSDADALIESLEQLLVKKRRVKQGAMQELLTGTRRLPGFSGEWEVKRLGEVAETDPENLGSDTRSTLTFNYIALEDVDVGTLKRYSEQMFRTAPSRARRKLRMDDILVSTVRPNLMSHLLFRFESERWVCSTGFCVVRCREGAVYPDYVYFHMFAGGVTRQIDALLTGSNYPAINGGDVRGLQIPFPDYEEQMAIAAILSDMDAEVAALEAKLAKARAIKQGMMQELLTGRIRLLSLPDKEAL